MSRQHRRSGPRVPQVNLFAQPPRGLSLPLPDHFVAIVLIAFVAVVWVAVGVGIALLFGWHPNVGLSL
jgi:hypothetical protein